MSAREKAMLGLAGFSLTIFVVWLAVWRPLSGQHERLTRQVSTLNSELPWIRAAAAQVERLSASGAPVSRGGQSLLSLAESSARGAGMADSWRRAEPGNEGQLRVWLENASFDTLMRWLSVLQQRYGVSVAEASIDQAGLPGVVNVRLLLAEPVTQ
ncbi:MAG: type II secretion system protein GspM [Lysobacterales bacterium]